MKFLQVIVRWKSQRLIQLFRFHLQSSEDCNRRLQMKPVELNLALWFLSIYNYIYYIFTFDPYVIFKHTLCLSIINMAVFQNCHMIWLDKFIRESLCIHYETFIAILSFRKKVRDSKLKYQLLDSLHFQEIRYFVWSERAEMWEMNWICHLLYSWI